MKYYEFNGRKFPMILCVVCWQFFGWFGVEEQEDL